MPGGFTTIGLKSNFVGTRSRRGSPASPARAQGPRYAGLAIADARSALGKLIARFRWPPQMILQKKGLKR